MSKDDIKIEEAPVKTIVEEAPKKEAPKKEAPKKVAPKKEEIKEGLVSKDGMWKVECKKDEFFWVVVPTAENKKAYGRFPVKEVQLRSMFGI